MSRDPIVTGLTALQVDSLACVVCGTDYLMVTARHWPVVRLEECLSLMDWHPPTVAASSSPLWTSCGSPPLVVVSPHQRRDVLHSPALTLSLFVVKVLAGCAVRG